MRLTPTRDAPQRVAYATLRTLGADSVSKQCQAVALQTVLKENCSNVQHDKAVGLLAEMLQERVSDFSRQMIAVSSDRSDNPDASNFPVRTVKGMLWLDAALAGSLRSIGPNGAQLAEKLEAKARLCWRRYEHASGDSEVNKNLWRLWIPGDQGVIRFVELIARALKRLCSSTSFGSEQTSSPVEVSDRQVLRRALDRQSIGH
jgi:hypothetical protein